MFGKGPLTPTGILLQIIEMYQILQSLEIHAGF